MTENNTESDGLSPIMPRAVPSRRFVLDLSEDIQRAARQKVGSNRHMPFEDMVIELRKLVRLLYKTLVPVSPRREFVQSVKEQLEGGAIQVSAARHRRWRWLMVGGVVGSIVSVAGLATAFLLRRRHHQLRAKKTVSAV